MRRHISLKSDTCTASKEHFCTGTEKMMEAVVERENMLIAYKRVVGNKGAAGGDTMGVDQLKPYLQTHWKRIKEQLVKGRYQPQPVLRVLIPKPGGKAMRRLGIPTIVDRLIQQALHQVLSRRWSTFAIAVEHFIGQTGQGTRKTRAPVLSLCR